MDGGVRLRPMGVGDVLDETFRVYRRHFLSFLVAMAVVEVPLSLLVAVLSVAFGVAGAGGRLESFFTRFEALARTNPGALFAGVFSFVAVMGVVTSLAYLLRGAAVTALASDAVLGRPTDVGSAYRRAFGRLPAVLLASILIALATGLLSITLIGIPVAIYLWVGWAVSVPAIVVEGLGGGASLRRGSGLVGGHRWRVLGVTVLLGLLTWILTSVPTSLVAVVGGLVAPEGSPAEPQIAVNVVNTLVSAAAQSLFGSLGWITATILYYELRVRKEAFDLEALAERAERLPPTPPYRP